MTATTKSTPATETTPTVVASRTAKATNKANNSRLREAAISNKQQITLLKMSNQECNDNDIKV